MNAIFMAVKYMISDAPCVVFILFVYVSL